jgi:O-antigen/teichoic acid export membrane protein
LKKFFSSYRPVFSPLAEKQLGKLQAYLSGQESRHIAGRNAVYTFTIRVMSAAIAYLSQIVLARLMGQYDYGLYVFIWVFVIITGTFAPLGLSTGVMRLIPEMTNRLAWPELRGLLVYTRLFTVFLAFAVGSAGLALLVWQPQLVPSQYYSIAMIALMCLPMMALIELQDGIARAYDWPDLAHLPPYIARPLLIIAFFLLALMMGFPATALTAMGASLVACWSVALGQLWILNTRLRQKIEAGPRQSYLGQWLKLSFPMLLVEGFFLLSINVDILMVGLFLTPEDVAIYYAASKTIALIHFVYFAVRAATAHKISHFHSSNDKAGLDAMIRDAVHWTFWPSLFFSLFLLIASPFILSLFGEGFAQGSSLIMILLIGVLVRASIGPADSILAMAGAQGTSAKIYCFVFFLNVALNALLIPVLGLAGAAVATTCAMITEAILLTISVKRHIGIVCFVGFLFRKPLVKSEML